MKIFISTKNTHVTVQVIETVILTPLGVFEFGYTHAIRVFLVWSAVQFVLNIAQHRLRPMIAGEQHCLPTSVIIIFWYR